MIGLLVELLESLGYDYGFMRLFDYLTVRALMGFATALGFSILFGFRVIVFLYDRSLRDTSGDFLSLSAASKRGTPTGGGLLVLLATSLAVFLWGDFSSPYFWPLVVGFAYFSVVGLLDDVLKARFKSSLSGLSQLGKTLLLLAFIVPFAAYLVSDWSPIPEAERTLVYLPFVKAAVLDLHPLLYIAFATFAIFSIVNAVNITDGMDGLLGGTSTLTLGVYVIFAYVVGNAVFARYLLFPFHAGAGEMAVFGGALIGAILGFMWFNTYPAEVFLGDTGALGIGGAMGMLAFLTKQELLFPIVGGIFVFEIFSSLVQQKFGDRLGRRIFTRAPFHHAMSHRGIPEPKVVVRFWIVSLILASLALLSLKVR